MSAEWKQFTIKEVAKVITGKTPPGTHERYFGGSTLFVTPTDMGDYKRIIVTNRTLSAEGEKTQRKYLFERGIVVSCIGWQMGKAAIVEKLAATNQQINTVIPNERLISFDFLYYIFKLKRSEIFNLGATATRTPILKKSLFEKITFKAPKIEQQRVISAHLSSLDQKIELNYQINQTLEQMAQALFKSWFVDFEPVKAKIAARARWQALQPENESASPVCYAAEFDEPPAVDDLDSYMNRAAMQAISGKTAAQLDALREEDPERYQELYETAALFPSAIQASELGEIPEGWEVTPFDKLARLDSSSIKPSEIPEKIWEHYSIPAFDAGKAPALDAGTSIKSGKYKVKKTSVLISKLNPGTSRVWWPEPLDNESAICSTEFMQFVPKSEELRAFIAGVISSSPFQAGVIASVTGSTGSRQRAQPKQVARMDVVAPCEALALRYAGQSRPLFTAQAKNISQSQKLAELRDTLLPKLLSGELTPSQAEEMLAEVTA